MLKIKTNVKAQFVLKDRKCNPRIVVCTHFLETLALQFITFGRIGNRHPQIHIAQEAREHAKRTVMKTTSHPKF